MQSVNEMFEKTADLYFTNIRPPTPTHLKTNTKHELDSYQMKLDQLDSHLEKAVKFEHNDKDFNR